MGVMLRWCTVLVAVTMLAAACGGGGDGDAGGAEPDRQVPASSATTGAIESIASELRPM